MPNQNTVKIVKWFLQKKTPPIIKFNDDESTYTLAQNVVEKNDFVKYPIKKGDTVEVGIKDSEITFLKKSSAKVEVPKEESKQETTQQKEPEQPKESEKEIVTESKNVTIYAVSGNKEVVKFTKENKLTYSQADPWVHVSKEIQAQDYSEIGLMANKKVNVTLENGIIVAVEKIEEIQSSESNIENIQPRTDTSDSIERQVCLKSATEIITAYIQSQAEIVNTADKTGALLISLTKQALRALRDA